jgi:sugar lactone lactonase YvrE
VAVAPSGDIVVVDTGNDRVRLVASGEVSTLAGSGVHGYADGPAPAARFSGPRDVVVSRDGVIYVADPGTQRVRVIEDSQVRSVDHQFTEPSALATDGEGRLFVAEAVSEHRVWRLSVRKRRTGQTCWSPRMELRPGSVVLDSEATECTTNLCLGYAGGDADSSIALCSAFCGSAKDCPTSTEACPGGFGCVPPMTTGPIAGRAMCVCSAHKLSASAECAEMGR